MNASHREPQHTSTISRRQAMQLGALTAGGVILGASAASTASAAPTAPALPAVPPTGTAGRDGACTGRRSPLSGPLNTINTLAPTSYNGWPVGTPGSTIGIHSYYVTGTSIAIPVDAGDVAWALMYVAARFNTEIEPLQGWQVWGYDYRRNVNNPSWWSCHASGTAIDLNAVLHPNGARGTFTASQVRGIRRILADCGNVVYWGGDFSGVPDEMHFEINVPPGDPRLPALVAKIRGVVIPPVVPVIIPPVVPVVTPPVVARQITLRAAVNNKLVTAENGGASALIANRSIEGHWEKFDVIAISSTHIALRAHANGRYVCADRAGSAPLIANRTAVGRWETFTVIPQPDGSVALLAAANGRYVSADNRGFAPLIANRTAVGLWERFFIATA